MSQRFSLVVLYDGESGAKVPKEREYAPEYQATVLTAKNDDAVIYEDDIRCP